MPDDSSTETYAALRLEVDNWRWAGVPIYLRTGKRLARKVTEIAVTLKPVPHLAFKQEGSVGVQPNQIILTMQPNEGASISLGAKIPGSRMRIRPVNMEFLYGTAFMSQSPEAYERLIMDAMRGDATLFTRDDEVEAQWTIVDPILEHWESNAGPIPQYPAGSGGPDEADELLAPRPQLEGDLTLSGHVWSAQDTSPAEVEAALRELLKERHAENEAYAPARVLNLVVVADREWRGEIQNRLDNVGRYHASRTILCAVEPGRTTIDAWATMTGEEEVKPGELVVCHEQVVLEVGEEHLEHLETIVDPLVVTDLATLVWSPHGHAEAVDALLDLAQIVLIDSVNEPDSASAVARAGTLAERAYIVDLAWLRSTPWRERVASTFDPPQWRDELGADQRCDRAPPAGLRHRRAAVLRLAVQAPGLEAGLDGGPERHDARQRRVRAARR